MRTSPAIGVFRPIAVLTEGLKPARVIVFIKPVIDSKRHMLDALTMFPTVIVYMVDAKKKLLAFTATSTNATIEIKRGLSQALISSLVCPAARKSGFLSIPLHIPSHLCLDALTVGCVVRPVPNFGTGLTGIVTLVILSERLRYLAIDTNTHY